MLKRDFNKWLKTFKGSIANYEYYVNFEKIYRNIETIKIELSILNALIGSQNIENDFEKIVNKYPETLKCIPLLLAIRSKKIYAVDSDGEFTYNFNKPNLSIEQYKIFMRKTGLFELLENKHITNLIDYATGVETGLDSNARKNRGGHLMENIVEEYLKSSGLVYGQDYFKEVYIREITRRWGVDLSAISNKGKSEKRFDFVIKTDEQIYVIETNCYSSSGSKLNETARSYKNIFQEVDTIEGVTFIWFTDGGGWEKARNNLEETFDVNQNIFNINDLENGIMDTIIRGKL